MTGFTSNNTVALIFRDCFVVRNFLMHYLPRSIRVFGHLRPAISVHVTVFRSVVGNDTPEQHFLICISAPRLQLCNHLVPTQLGAQDLVRAFHKVVPHVPTDAFISTHFKFPFF